jgi:capsular polysaccharide export protein
MGVITVNSTSGIRALQLGKPVKVLGQAIYDVVGLTHQGEIDDFWQRPMPPDGVLLDSFIKVLASKFQVRGTFFSHLGRKAAVAGAVRYLSDRSFGDKCFI